MIKVMASVVIEAPLAAVWAAVRGFDRVADWNPGVIAARMESGAPTEVGSIRRLEATDGSVFRETLLAHSDHGHYYTYDILESPLACWNYISTHRFIPITDGGLTLGVWEGAFDCAPGDAQPLTALVGDAIYRDGMRGLNRYLKEKSHG